MRINKNDLRCSFVHLHNNEWIEKQRIAGKCVADIMKILSELVKNKTKLTLLEMDKIVENEILSRNCVPTFKNYKGFPASICLSVNNQLVHSIPSNYSLQEGDLITFDFGATYQGAIADSAITVIYGKPKSEEHIKLIETTKNALIKGIEAIQVGKQVGCIGNAIYNFVKDSGFGLITQYGGHGITWNKVHSEPFVANRSELNEGIRIQSGLSIAIEPLLVLGNNTNTEVGADGWTVFTSDLSAHFEDTVFIHENGVEIISDRRDYEISNRYVG